MGAVVKLAGRRGESREETILEFVVRELAVSTYSVACRFGMEIGEARRQLKELESEGLLQSRREIFDYCAMYGWRATDKAKLRLTDKPQQRG